MATAYSQNFKEIDWSGLKPPERAARTLPARSDNVAAPLVVMDGCEVKSMVDGRIYTSKAALRRSYREKGYVEVGNETLNPAPKPKPDTKGIRDSIGRAFNRAGLPTG